MVNQRILVLSFYYHPDLSAGSFRTTALVKALLQKKEFNGDVDVITTLPNRYSSCILEAKEHEHSPRLHIQRIKVPLHKSGMLDQAISFFYFAKQALKLVRQKQYHLVYATSSRLMTAALGAWISKRQKAKFYLDIRDIFVDTIENIFPRLIAKLVVPFFYFIERWSIHQADKVNLVSEGFKSYFQLHYPRLQFSYFTNGIDEEFIRVIPIFEKKKKELKTIILYAGNIGKGQGLHAILPELAKRMKEKAVFKIIGDGGCKDALSEALQKARVDNVLLLPPMKRDKLIEAYQKADVLFLHLNDYDAFKKVLPSKIFEYAAMGKPIWAGVSGYAAEFLKTEVSNVAVFHPCNALEAEKEFEKLSMDDAPRAEFVEKFSRDKIMQSMAESLLSLT